MQAGTLVAVCVLVLLVERGACGTEFEPLSAGAALQETLIQQVLGVGEHQPSDQEQKGQQRRNNLETSSGNATLAESGVEKIQGTWVGLTEPPIAKTTRGQFICASEAKHYRPYCLTKLQRKIEIEGDSLSYMEMEASCNRCSLHTASAGLATGNVTKFENSRLEFSYFQKDMLGGGDQQSVASGRKDACINMHVFVEDGRVLADVRIQTDVSGSPTEVLDELDHLGISQCTPEPLTCKVELSSYRVTLKFSSPSLMQCVSGKCLEMAGPNAQEPNSHDPCYLNIDGAHEAHRTHEAHGAHGSHHTHRAHHTHEADGHHGAHGPAVGVIFLVLIAALVLLPMLVYFGKKFLDSRKSTEPGQPEYQSL